MFKYLTLMLLSFSSVYSFDYGCCDRELQPVLEKIMELSEGKDLWQKIHQAGPIRIRAMHGTHRDFKAFWEGEQRLICVNVGIRPTIDEQICSLLFELHNAASDPKVINVYNQAASGRISQATFATEMERLEYENSLQACDCLEKGIEKGIFPKECYLQRFRNFDDFLVMQKQHGHFQHYLRTYHDIQGEIFY